MILKDWESSGWASGGIS